jgi:hypothetical protein
VDLSKIFLVTNFPTAFTTDTFQEEARFGPSVRVKWVTDTSCLVIVLAQKEGEDVATRVKEFKDWEVVALHDVVPEVLGPLSKKIKVDH